MDAHRKRPPRPPALALALLDRICGDAYVEEFGGDLEELFAYRVQTGSLAVARLRFWIDVLSFLRLRFLRKPARSDYRPMMFKNYLRVAWRGVRRNRSYAIVNVAGLGVGLACCMLIGLFIQDERAYDAFHSAGDRIYRVTGEEDLAGRSVHRASTYVPLVPALLREFPSIERATRIKPYPVLVRSDADHVGQEDGFLFVDSTFFEVFSMPLVAGDPRTVLDRPFSIVVTPSVAARYFGTRDPIGRTLTLRTDRGTHDFTVTGVAAEVLEHSHIRFDLVGTISSLLTIAPHMDSWFWPPVYSYVQLRAGADPEHLDDGLPVITENYLAPLGVERAYHMQPLGDIHLRSDLENELSPNGSIRAVTLFGLVALLILLIAGINFMNLATARSANRAREVGMRKVLGAARLQLMQQFLTESIVTTLLATLLAVGLVAASLPTFNAMAGKHLTMSMLWNAQAVGALALLVLVVGVGTGSYPAFFLSAFRPIRVLKGAFVRRGGAAVLRRGLVVFQFAVTSSLIVGTLVIHKQLRYLQHDRLGFDKEHVVVVPLRDMEDQINHQSLKDEWRRDPRVVSVASSSGFPSYTQGLHDFRVVPEGAEQDSVDMLILTVDHDFAETYGLEVLAGRDFSDAHPTDATEAFVINQSAARKLGWADPVGKELTLEFYVRGREIKKGRVIGLVRDFQYHSLHESVEPIVLHVLPNSFFNDYLSARLSPADIPGALAHLEERWAAFNPDRPFEFRFVDDVFGAMYRADVRMGQILGAFTGLAILVACLGLFALAAFTTEQRTKEIGVRKVLGASVGGIVALLSKDFLRLVALAFVLAVPVAYFASDLWLSGFAERIPLGAGLFVRAGLAALVIGVAAVGFQALRAALANPASSLRYE